MTSPREAFDPVQAKAWIDDVLVLQSRTRRARRGLWFPLVLFGLVILASTPLYVSPMMTPAPAFLTPDVPSSPSTFAGNGGYSGLLGFSPGGMFSFSPLMVTVFWLVATPVGYVLTAGFYWLQARRRGVATSIRAYVLTGLGLFALLVATSTPVVRVSFPGDLTIRGLTPLIAVALGLFVLARVERSWALLAFAVPFLALSVAANLYNMENVVYRLGLGSAGPEVNVIVVGSVLLLAGVIFGLAAVRERRRPS
ncbi:MAG: hypothetical protein ACYDDU_18110 [Dermatophilaceae bacterium]